MRYYILIPLLLLLGSCKPVATEEPLPEPGYYFHNKTPRTVQVDVFHQPPNEGGQQPPKVHLLRMQVRPGEKAKMNDESFTFNTNYSYKWYSDDYRYSNWHLPDQAFTVLGGARSEIVLDGKPRMELLTCLSGYGSETQWRAVNAFNANGVSVWDTLAYAKQNSFVLLYNKKLNGFAKKSNSIDTIYTGSFMITDTSERIWITTGLARTVLAISNDARPYTPRYTYSADTLYTMYFTPGNTGNFEDNILRLPVYMFVKEATR
jgi:hypothetical protein